MVSDEQYDLYTSYFYDGIRSRVIRNLLKQACEGIKSKDSNLTVDSIVRGEFSMRKRMEPYENW